MVRTMDTRRVLKVMPDPRTERLRTVKQELGDPGRLTDEQIAELIQEMAEIKYSLDRNPAEEN